MSEDKPADANEQGSKWENMAEQASPEPEVADPGLIDGAEEAAGLNIGGFSEQLEQLQTLADSRQEEVLRTRADMENLRRRSQNEVTNARKFATEKLMKDMLPVLDGLVMGLKACENIPPEAHSVLEGLQMTEKMLLDTLAKHGLQPLDPKGERFNPEHHEAITMVPSPDHEPNTIIDVVQLGFSLNGRLVRPAKVIISKSE